MDIPRILDLLHRKEFKPNCALGRMFQLLPVDENTDALSSALCSVMVDFLFRHRLITPDSEENYELIRSRLRRDLGLPGIVVRQDE